MRLLAPCLLLATALLTACGGGDACRQYCQAQVDCFSTDTDGDGEDDEDAVDDCYDDYRASLALPGVRELTLSSCDDSRESLEGTCP